MVPPELTVPGQRLPGQRLRRAIVLAAIACLGPSCHRDQRYETEVEILRISPVRKDESGHVRTLDLEFKYVACPSAPIEVVRGDAEFAACVARHRIGERLRIAGQHTWLREGFWTFRVDTVGDCRRKWDPADEASFQLVRECEEFKVNDVAVGFHCNVVPAKALLDACPWFRRR